jgi:hypothetical protein
MDKNKVKVDGTQIMLSLFEKYKNETWVLSSSEIEKKIQSWFPGKWGNYGFNLYKHKIGLISGVTVNQYGEVFFLVDNERGVKRNFNSLDEIKEIFHIHDSTTIKINYVWENCFIKMSEPEINFLQEFLDKFSSEVDKIILNTEKKSKEKEKESKEIEKESKEKEKQQFESLKQSQISFLQDFDKDGNKEVDLIDGESFNKLLNKNQKSVSEIDKKYIQKFVKITMYLKTKKSNTQKIFDSIKKTKNEIELNELVNLLKNQIHTYELLVFHSINMITSLVDSDLVTFYEIYECFDQLGVFNSNWENYVSDKLTDIGDGIKDLMYSIYQMENKIVNSIDNLTYVTQDSFKELNISVNNQLNSIDSSIKFNNLLTGIQTYQMYKINQNT